LELNVYASIQFELLDPTITKKFLSDPKSEPAQVTRVLMRRRRIQALTLGVGGNSIIQKWGKIPKKAITQPRLDRSPRFLSSAIFQGDVDVHRVEEAGTARIIC
jgi:hypothetical protein